MSDDVKAELARRVVGAKATVDEFRASMFGTLSYIYVDHIGAFYRMRDFVQERGKAGEAALVKKLEEDPAFFGTTKGHLGSPTFLKFSGFSDRADVAAVVGSLPAKVRAVQDAENRLHDLQVAFSGDLRPIELELSRGRGGPER
ncbi:hypothetical protein N182_34040 [Sinorhizobium sp. GL2]|nr:hypothetical protein N182_34040 [Sinorhizobium sp. GL2]